MVVALLIATVTYGICHGMIYLINIDWKYVLIIPGLIVLFFIYHLVSPHIDNFMDALMNNKEQ